MVLTGGCATHVERLQTSQVEDLSGAWNDTVSQQVSEEMIGDVLSAPWLANYDRDHGSPPAVSVGEIRNLSHEHISTETFVADIERNVINSGKLEIVASREQLQDIRGERKDQDINASDQTRKAMGQEQGADFMLKGAINTIIDASGSTQVRYYQVDLSMISLADNAVVWVGGKKIKKLVENSKLRL